MTVRLTTPVVAGAFLLLSISTALAQTWTPPIGIPAPSFGIVEKAPASPSPWTVPTTGFYYVDWSSPAATDLSNPLGTPAKPRETIPTTLPAGAVVELHGTYDYPHESPRTIVANGTATAPVYIRGASASAKPLIRRGWEVKGNYIILENLEFGPDGQANTGFLVFLSPINHAALRHSHLHGNLDSGGIGVGSWDGALNQNVVIWDNNIHDNGDVNATFDQDVMGIHVGIRVSNLWVVDNQLYRNSGDGIQINAGSPGAINTTHHIYVGRNTAYSNKQTGFWVKHATDVIFSQNVCHSHRLGNSSNGQCMGFQYAPNYIWFLFNTISNSDYGIAAQSDDDGVGTESFFIGNVIYNIYPSSGNNDPGNAWAGAGIMLAGSTNRRVLHNTMYDVNAGVNVPASGGTLEVRDNIISRVAKDHLFVQNPTLAAGTVFNHNILEGDPRVRMGGSQQHLTTAQLTAMQSFGVDPLFVNPAGADFHVQAASKAVDTGDLPSAYTTFQQRYGLSIAKDAEGRALPSGPAPDIGAYERDVSCAAAPPDAPAGLTASVSALTVTLSWTAPGGCNVPNNYWLEAALTPGGTSVGGAFLGSTATAVTFPVAAPGYFYARVKASNSIGLSASSNAALVSAGVPNPPTNLVGSVSGTTMNLSWQAPTGGVTRTGYVLEVGLAAGRVDASVPLSASITSLSLPGATPRTYYIRLRAVAGTYKGAPSNEVVLTVQ
jgi:parallel beta helix pectate lyase-like protein/fibronectin type III domain protein